MYVIFWQPRPSLILYLQLGGSSGESGAQWIGETERAIQFGNRFSAEETLRYLATQTRVLPVGSEKSVGIEFIGEARNDK